MEFVEFLLRFIFGISGALVIVFLRIFELMPRMSKSGEIILHEESKKDLQKRWEEIHEKMKQIQEKKGNEMLKKSNGNRQVELEVKELEALSNSYKITLDNISARMNLLEKELSSLKRGQWAIGAILFTFLGGIFALFMPELIGGKPVVVDNMLSGEGALFSMLVGATWTTYISMFEHKLSDKELVESKNKSIDDLIATRDSLVAIKNRLVSEVESRSEKGNQLLSYYKQLKEELEEYKSKFGEIT